ncbi:PadR family transcriptional regulator [Sinanaerobacter sp. ZZT-01]|uniref:PadR family transcriptional regulator n=1 Tax=Sinanaerobacter sp. ZZT-01 TaxID=3111540 RepID=UPI002D76CAF4|nr:PadR family transcriptional regulator [Sinanaerobacter sp. ZZT-01]WRR94646.1 PadR family transcriptional regulator [Sinanaerobacter sp. ZZT-01]
MARKSEKLEQKPNLKESGHSFGDYFKRAVNPMLVLRLLSEKPMYVYQMTQELKQRGDSECTVSFLYPVLYRLQKLGYVEESGKQISEDNRVRNYYAITQMGQEHLEALSKEYQQLVLSVEKIMKGYHD